MAEAQAYENAIVNKALTPLPNPHITGLKLSGDISLGDLVFNTIDDAGVVWVITDIDGWWNHPDPDMPDFPRGNADGSYDVRGRWQARQLTLSGVFLPPDPSLVPAARDRLIEATSLVYQGKWLRVYENEPKASFVRLSGRPDIRTINARGRTEFSIGLRASDPIKYSWSDLDPQGFNILTIPAANAATGATGIGIINNIGSISVPIYMQVLGPINGPATIVKSNIAETSSSIEIFTILDPFSGGSTLEIDTYDNSVALDGVTLGARSMLDPLTDWIKLQPGPNVITFTDSAVNSGAQLIVYYRSGWIG